MWTIRLGGLAALAATLAVLAAAPAWGAPPAHPRDAELNRELEDARAAIAWIDFVLSRTDRGDMVVSMEDPDQWNDAEARVVPVNRDTLLRVVREAVASGDITSAEGAAMIVHWGRASGNKIRALRQERAELAKRQAELRARLARPPAPLRPWELGRPPEAKIALCVAEGVWSNTAQGRGSSTWTIKADGKATESGMGNATGQASLSGDTLTITWRTGPVAGVYRIDVFADCSGGDGELTFSDGPPGFDRSPAAAEFSRVSGPTGGDEKY